MVSEEIADDGGGSVNRDISSGDVSGIYCPYVDGMHVRGTWSANWIDTLTLPWAFVQNGSANGSGISNVLCNADPRHSLPASESPENLRTLRVLPR